MERHLINQYDDLAAVLQQSKPLSKNHLGEILVEEGWLTDLQLQEVLKLQRTESTKHLGELVIDANLCNREQIREALATKLGFPFITLGEYEIPSDILSIVTTELARHYKVLPLATINSHLVVAMETPLDQEALNALGFHTNQRIDPVMASTDEIQQLLDKYYNPMIDGEIDGMLEALELNPLQEDKDDTSSLQKIASEAQKKPIVKLTNAIITNGILKGASDINIRPEKDKVSIYYRVFGKLLFSRSLHKSLLAPIVNRIKITGRMDISERRLPQDGHARVMRDEHTIDLRISSMPTVDGESIVIRILDKDAGLKPLSEVGFSMRDYAIVNRLLQRSFGLILVTGPTGSGKSTSLYALLNEIRKREPHIITVEDPVEYDMAGVEQIQIVPAIEYTFSRALRNILRHDPDVIMVGEIRDEETAEITNKAALTGHLVLSTLHTNSAASTITRLFDMNIKP
ncbi:MAG: type II secretion system protein GspE, partial [Gammaproteobacteria bacterium]|nr:type II secretion system protein GspE [Gammaproteobacteria bacterium]